MRWSPKPPEIGPLDGFSKTDLFEYREFGQHLAKLIGSLEDDPVLVLDGPWGSGKTTFSHQLAGVLRKQGHAVAYFDAFAADHHKDPFLALVEEVHCLATEAGLDPDSKILDKFTKGAAVVGKELSLAALDVTLPGLGRLVGRAIEAGSEPDPPLLEEWIQQAGARKKALSSFRERLAAVAETLTAMEAEDKQEDATSTEPDTPIRPRLVFIVDELDRCRPTFALAVLERIKHIFGVQGVTFLLVANLKELGKSVLKVYGDVDEKRYLEKFFEIVVRLPKSSAGGNKLTIRAYVHHLSQQLGFTRKDIYGDRSLQFLCALAEAENLSLRSLEHTMRLALVLAPSARPNVVALLPILRVARPKLFDRIMQMTQNPLAEEDLEELEQLADHIGNKDARNSLLSDLEPNSELAYFARLLDQYRVR